MLSGIRYVYAARYSYSSSSSYSSTTDNCNLHILARWVGCSLTLKNHDEQGTRSLSHSPLLTPCPSQAKKCTCWLRCVALRCVALRCASANFGGSLSPSPSRAGLAVATEETRWPAGWLAGLPYHSRSRSCQSQQLPINTFLKRARSHYGSCKHKSKTL